MDDFKYIKKHYGEKMAQLCRDLFPTILETPGELSRIMGECFYPAKYLYYDIVANNLKNQFRNYIYKRFEREQKELISSNKTPFKLMEEAGYELIECKTEEDIQVFRKYYDKRGQKYDMCRNEIPCHVGEELCTFDGGRLESCHVFFAVKKEAEKLKREEFKNPMREDEYGTSVISIQFSRQSYILSIKNRYNHTVNNPDATFGNNLENIIPGLTKSFEEYYGHEIKQNNEDNFEIPNYVEVNGKLYKYNYEINNIYYCPDNIIIKNGEAITTYNEKQERYIIMDYFILDLKAKTLTLLDETIKDSFIDEYKNIEKIDIKKEASDKIITITTKEGIESKITINNQNQIIGYENIQIKTIKDSFFKNANYLEDLKLPNIEIIGKNSFIVAKQLREIYLPKLQTMGEGCFRTCSSVKEITLPELIKIQEYCFETVPILEHLNLSKIEKIEYGGFEKAGKIKKLNLPKLKSVGNCCFKFCDSVQEINFPEIVRIGRNSFARLYELEKINMPKLEEIGRFSFYITGKIKTIYLPKVKKMEELCFKFLVSLQTLNLPELEELGDSCFNYMESLTELYLPELRSMGSGCFEVCGRLEHLNIPKLVEMNNDCFKYSDNLKSIKMPEIRTISKNCFLVSELDDVIMPNLQVCESKVIILMLGGNQHIQR